MAKSQEKLEAQKMRREGKSIKTIAETLGVSKSSASIWCNEIVLTKKQAESLHASMIAGSYAGRMKGATMNKQKRLDRIDFWNQHAVQTLGTLNQRDLLLAGIGLYLGEGSKKKRQFQFTNSEPELINACIKWLELFKITTNDLYCHIFINEIHKDRIVQITREWSKITKIPLKNFRKPVFIKARVKKLYANHDTYLGVLSLYSFRSSELFYRILGLMKVFLYNTKTAKASIA